jgi:biotin carboxyl carrier protein
MRYTIKVEGREHVVDIGEDGVRVDDARVDAELVALPGTGVHHLRLDGQGSAITARSGERGFWRIQLGGRAYDVEVVDERTRAIRQLAGVSAVAQGPKPIKAPMPGLVLRVEVAPGDSVRPGQGVVVVEAMKMENELKAEVAGVVSRVLIEAGQAVEKGTVLVEFEAHGEA